MSDWLLDASIERAVRDMEMHRWVAHPDRTDLAWLWAMVAQAALCERFVEILATTSGGASMSRAERLTFERAFLTDDLRVA